jgi:ATP-dependent DNA ligase
MISRNGKPQDSVYRHLRQTIYDQLEASPFQSVKLDGEIVLVDREGEKPLPFNDLQKQRR